jgi:alkaline phosphatase
MISRRRFFSQTTLAAGGLAGAPHLARSADKLLTTPGQNPARIIHMVADGMSLGTLTAADYFSLNLRQCSLRWTRLMTDPLVRHGLMNMRSLNSMVTDSSAASSSWGSGSRVKNGAINQLPNGKELTPLYELFRDQGWKRGLVTTTEITHATPAGFAACVSSRETAARIAEQYLERKVDVLLGGGEKFFSAAKRKDKRDLSSDFSAAGYHVMRTAADLGAADLAKPWLGTFSSGHLPYTLDMGREPALRSRVPTLPQMTSRALDWLERHDHFILQVEGGRVDHGAHNCDAAAAMHDLVAFDQALEVALAFQSRHPDTLIVVTTDHGNGNLGVNGTGSGYGSSSALFKNLGKIKASFPEIMRQLRHGPNEEATPQEDVAPATRRTPEPAKTPTDPKPKNYVPDLKEIQAVIADTTGYNVSDRRAGLFKTCLEGKGAGLYDLMNEDVLQLGQLLGNYLSIGWTSGSHTADYVPITAVGPGSERFVGLIQNTDVFRHYTQLAGIDFKNPEEPLLAMSGPEAGEVEDLRQYALV